MDVIELKKRRDYINSTFCWKKKWKFLFSPFNLEHEILIGKAVFHFVSVEATLIFSHGMHLSNSCAEKLAHLLLFPPFLRLQTAILPISTVVKKVRSNGFRKSKCIPMSVFWEECQSCDSIRDASKKADHIKVFTVFFVKKNISSKVACSLDGEWSWLWQFWL